MIEYNGSTFHDLFNNPVPVDDFITDLNPPPVPIDDSPCPNKIALYTSDPLTPAIYFTYINSVGILPPLLNTHNLLS